MTSRRLTPKSDQIIRDLGKLIAVPLDDGFYAIARAMRKDRAHGLLIEVFAQCRWRRIVTETTYNDCDDYKDLRFKMGDKVTGYAVFQNGIEHKASFEEVQGLEELITEVGTIIKKRIIDELKRQGCWPPQRK